MDTFYLVGLGNPGTQYDSTRHNIGRSVVAALAESAGVSLTEDKHAAARIARGGIGEADAVFVLPETYMNRSGDSLRYFVEKHGAAPERIIVVYDDIDLPLGSFKVSTGRGDGGHNGIKSMISALGSKEFPRIRIGIAPTSFWTGAVKRPPAGGPLERYVLGRFSSRERAKVAECESTIAEAIKTIITDGVPAAMNRYN